jgi:hypothetical protein
MAPYTIRTLHLPPSSVMLGAIMFGIIGCIGSLRGSSGRSVGHTLGRDRIPDRIDDCLVLSDEGSRGESKRRDTCFGDPDLDVEPQ